MSIWIVNSHYCCLRDLNIALSLQELVVSCLSSSTIFCRAVMRNLALVVRVVSVLVMLYGTPLAGELMGAIIMIPCRL